MAKAKLEDIGTIIEEDKKTKRSFKTNFSLLKTLEEILNCRAEMKRQERKEAREREDAKTKELEAKAKEIEEEWDRKEA